jgi:hypothetical protein
MKFIEAFWRDLHYSARMLLKRRGFALVAVMTLALGIGANTAIFSLVRGVLLRALPFSESDRLIGIRESKVGEGHNNPMAFRTFAEIRDKAQTIEFIAAYLNSNPTIEQGDGTVSLQGSRVSHSYFKVLGVNPILGRDFTPEDNKLGAPLTAIRRMKSGWVARSSSSTKHLHVVSFRARTQSANESRLVIGIRHIQPSSASSLITFNPGLIILFGKRCFIRTSTLPTRR